MQDLYRSWNYSDKYVCWRCVVNDDYLVELLQNAGDPNDRCTYCGGAGAASLDVLLELVDDHAGSGYEDADTYPGVYSSADGGYQFETFDLREVQENFLADYVEDGDLMEDVLDSFEPRLLADSSDYYYDDMLGDPWGRFAYLVMHRSRYMFWTNSETLNSGNHHWYGDSPVRVLEDLGERLRNRGLIRKLAGSVIWRAHGHRGNTIEGGATARRLGTVPEALAFGPNRMSAPGVPMFYGALDKNTAVVEATRHGDPMWDHATVAAFVPTRELVVLDLTNVVIPEAPSLFRDANDPLVLEHNDALFLHAFVETVSKPVSDNPARRGIDYVPTQVFTEFVLHAMGGVAQPPIQLDGIVYPSAEVEGGANLVLDVENQRCVAEPSRFALERHQLELVLDRDSIGVAERRWTTDPR